MMRKIRITTEGVRDAVIMDAETGEKIEGVKRAVVEVTCGRRTCVLEFATLEMEGEFFATGARLRAFERQIADAKYITQAALRPGLMDEGTRAVLSGILAALGPEAGNPVA